MGHCSLSGAGPRHIGSGASEPRALRDADHHVVGALWGSSKASRRVDHRRPRRGRQGDRPPVCAYPAQARYKGLGDVNRRRVSVRDAKGQRIGLDRQRHDFDTELVAAAGGEGAGSVSAPVTV
jgi:hypothetical protein